jgi:hypothetical protein
VYVSLAVGNQYPDLPMINRSCVGTRCTGLCTNRSCIVLAARCTGAAFARKHVIESVWTVVTMVRG